MAGRKRKIPEGYVPQWESSSDSDTSHSEFKNRIFTPTLSQPPPPLQPQRQPEIEIEVRGEPVDEVEVNPNDDHELLDGIPQNDPISDVYFQVQMVDNDRKQDEETEETDLRPYEEPDLYDEPDISEDEEPNAFNLEEPDTHQQHDQREIEEEERDGNSEREDEEAQFPSYDEFWPISSELEEVEEDKESFIYLLKKFSEEWIINEVHHKVSKVASSEFWNITAKWMFSLASAFEKERKSKFPKFAHIRRKLINQHVPRISLQTGYIDKSTQELSIASDTEKIPVHRFPADKYQKVFEIASVEVLY